MKQHRVSSLAFLCLALSTTVISCKKDDILPADQQVTATPTPGISTEGLAANATGTNTLATTATTANTGFVLPYYRSINWDGRADGLYSQTQASADLGPTAYWKVTSASQTQTYSKMLQTTLLKNALTAGGVFSK
ncbi:hypothetical protein EPD60_12460, partial [Flaviaesturariibacter flavus]